jgi:hypothetical protein
VPAVSSTRRCLIGISTLVSILLHASVSPAAEDPPLKLVWTAPPNCPQQAQVSARIQELLGPAQEHKPIELLTARGLIVPTSEQFQLTLQIKDGATTGTRTITSTNCRSLSDAAAVVISLLVRQRRELGRALSDAELNRGQGPGRDTAAENPGVDPGSASSPVTQPVAPPRAANGEVARDEQAQNKNPPKVLRLTHEPGWRLLLSAPVGQLELATLPKPSLGAGLALGIANGRWQFLVSGALYARQSKHVADRRDYDAEFLNRSVSVWACRVWQSAPFHVTPCFVAAMNNVEASTSVNALGMSSSGRTHFFPSTGLGVEGSVHFTRTLALFARSSGRLNFARPEFVFADELWGQQSIHRVSRGSLDLALGLAWSI